MDACLVPELRLDRHHRQARRLLTAITAALADPFVDPDPIGWLRELSPVAEPPLLGCARIVVDYDGHASHLLELGHHLGKVVAVAHFGHRIEGDPAVLLGLGSGHHHLAHTLNGEQPGQIGHIHPSERFLAASHGHGAVVKEAVGDVDTGRHRCSHGERAGVEERPVAQVLEVVMAAGEGRQADPLGPLATHLGEPHVVAPAVLIEGGHDVTTDAEPDELVIGRPRRNVVGAARTEIRSPQRQRSEAEPSARTGRKLGHAVDGAGRQTVLPEAAGEGLGHGVGSDGAGRREKGTPIGVELAGDPRSAGAAVEGLLQL